MSKRYGRNQKRAARRRIEQLERSAVYYTEVNRQMERRAVFAERDLDTVRRALGPNFIGLSPGMLVREVCRISEDYDFPYPVRDGVLPMRSMTYSLFDDSFRPEHQIHFRVELAGGRVGYVLSEPALRHTPADVLARHIAGELAQLLVRDIKAGRAGSRR